MVRPLVNIKEQHMNLINEVVYHKLFGKGIVVEQSNEIIKVQFYETVKKFPYPMIFDEAMSINNNDIQYQIEQIIYDEKEKQKRDKDLRMLEYENRFADANNEPSKAISRKQQGRDICGIALKYNYCDGGSNRQNIGFYGVCSDLMIRENIKKLKRVWCSSEDSPCKQYLDGSITRGELDDIFNDGSFVCYESRLLRDWIAAVGRYQSEDKYDKPKTISNVRPNRLCVLTTRKPLTSENDRIIIAAFIIKDVVHGNDSVEGNVTAYDRYRIQLTRKEADMMPFWNFYKNKSKSDTPAWSSGLFRYLTDVQSAQVLKEIVKIKTDMKQKDLAQEMLQFFLEKNAIDINSVSEPNSTITY